MESSARRNQLRLPEYLRLDLRADRTFTYRKSRLTLFLEVVNALNRENFRGNSPGVNVNTRRVFETHRVAVSAAAGRWGADRVLTTKTDRGQSPPKN